MISDANAHINGPQTPPLTEPFTPYPSTNHCKCQRPKLVVVASTSNTAAHIQVWLQNMQSQGSSEMSQIPSVDQYADPSVSIPYFKANADILEQEMKEMLDDDQFFESIPCSPDVMSNKQRLSWVYVNGMIKNLGSGTYGSVCLARLNDGPLVAVKLFKKHQNSVKTIMHEASLQTWLSSNQLAPHFHGLVSLSETSQYLNIGLVMEFLGDANTYETTRLCDLVNLPGVDWRYVGKQLAEQLSKIHKLNVIMNDIKGDNIIFHWVDGKLKIYFIDLGLAMYAPGHYTCRLPRNPDGLKPFHPVTAPERDLYGLTTPKSDIFSMGEMFRRIQNFTGGNQLDDLVSLCKQHNHKLRPSASVLAQMLSTDK